MTPPPKPCPLVEQARILSALHRTGRESGPRILIYTLKDGGVLPDSLQMATPLKLHRLDPKTDSDAAPAVA